MVGRRARSAHCAIVWVSPSIAGENVRSVEKLFESDKPPIALPLDQTKSLVKMVRGLLIEIAATSKVEEAGDDEDHA